jgi:hypothetical protein
MVLNSMGLSFDQPPSSAEQDPERERRRKGKLIAVSSIYRDSGLWQGRKGWANMPGLLIIAIIGSFIWLYIYTVKATTATTRIAELQTLAMEEGKQTFSPSR